MAKTESASNITTVRAGFIPLVDCAVLVVAREKGFAEAHGIDLQLFKEVSWANIRDRVNVGQFDVAHMLAGMPIAANMGIGHIKVPMIAPMALGAGGNAITLSYGLYEALAQSGLDLLAPLASGDALRAVIERRRVQGLEPLTFGMVFPFSNHNYQLRYWMAAAGIDPDFDVRLVVIPPPFMVQSLQAGQIDGFCVGEPWNTLAAKKGVGKVLLSGSSVWPDGPEKVLGMQESWAQNNPDVLAALLRALDQAARWADDHAHHAELAGILARAEYLDVPERHIALALEGDLRFCTAASCDHALWLYAQMVRWGQTLLLPSGEQAACCTYRPDLLADALGKNHVQPQIPNVRPLDGVVFDPADVAGYIAAESIKCRNFEQKK
ncbi:MAG: ABC transporter substrate-binding protein [Rhodospirillales bacterium]|nr:ABC transporter substrate-binding protein [Rhodospirillales bacterium]